MKLNFSDQYNELVESYSQISTVKRTRFPRGLHLSEGFVNAVRSEYSKLIEPIISEDSDGNKITRTPCPSKVLEQLKKALPFLISID